MCAFPNQQVNNLRFWLRTLRYLNFFVIVFGCFNEFVLTGCVNLNWLQPGSDNLKSFCDSLNLFQLVNSPTKPKLKCSESCYSTLALILRNAPPKFSTSSVFVNDISDQCC